MKKVILAIFLAACLIFAMTACTDQPKTNETVTTEKPESGTTAEQGTTEEPGTGSGSGVHNDGANTEGGWGELITV